MANKISPWIAIPPIIFACLAALFAFGLGREDADGLPSTMIGRQAPKLTVSQFADLPSFSENDLQASGVKLVNFWASWCGPCRVEHPNLMALANSGTTVFGINYKDQPSNALAFLQELGNPYSKIVADNGRTGLDWGLYGVPETFVIDPEGKVLLRHAGPLTQRIIEQQILPLIRTKSE